METSRQSSKGRVVIPKSVRRAHRWEAGLDCAIIDTGDGILLRPKAPFEPTALAKPERDDRHERRRRRYR
jgi:AbrB family looped-hinge helix DNA binding protein